MKKLLAILLAMVMIFSLVACGGGSTESEDTDSEAAANVKIGVILVGDENEGYTYAHIEGLQKACDELGIDYTDSNQVIWKYKVEENETCFDAAADLVDSGCNVIFSNSYGHQDFMKQAATEFPDVQFVALTGDNAISSGLDNLNNAFPQTYEARYVSGVVAGLKLQELIDNNQVPASGIDADGNYKLGYVGAYPYAEVVSGYTAFFLGVQSIVPNVAMTVTYTNSWFTITGEAEACKSLQSMGCVIISQHADSTGAPQAAQELLDKGEVVYEVGYNVDMHAVSPQACLTSATNNWSVYYKEALESFIAGNGIPKEWSKGYADGAVGITELGESVAEGTAEKVAEVEEAIKSGELHVFDTSKFTVNGEHLDSYDQTYGFEGNEMIYDGYFHESELRAAPCFDIRIDGITELQ